MPEHTAADNRKQTDLVRETATGLFIGRKLGGEGQPAPGEHRDQTLGATRTDQAIEGHGGEMVEDRAQLQTEPAMRGQPGVAGHLWSHVALAADEVGQHREHRTTHRALEPPDGELTSTDLDVMGVACQAPASLTGRLVFQLKAKGQEKGDHQFDKRLAIVKPLNVDRFIVEIDGDGAVVSRLCGCCGP